VLSFFFFSFLCTQPAACLMAAWSVSLNPGKGHSMSKDKLEHIGHVRRLLKDAKSTNSYKERGCTAVDILSNWVNLDDEHILAQWDKFDHLLEKHGPMVTTLIHGF